MRPGWKELPDPKVLAFATHQNRILVTWECDRELESRLEL